MVEVHVGAYDPFDSVNCFCRVNDNDLRRRLKEVSLVTFPMETRRNSEAHAKQPKEKETPTEFVEGIQVGI